MPNDLEARVRRAFHEQTALHPFVPREPGEVRREARLRLMRNGIGAALVAVLLLAASVAALGSFRADRTPAHLPTPIGAERPKELAFIRQLKGIYLTDGEGHTRPLAGGTDAFGGWYPDGKSFLMYTEPSKDPTVYRVGINGGRHFALFYPKGLSGTTALTLTGWYPTTEMALSPDGRQIVFGAATSADWSRGRGLYVFGLQGHETREIFHGQAFQPAWSPDGTQIAFTGPHVQIVGADGNGLRTLPLPPGTRNADGPAWSPDGQWIAMWVERHGLWIVRPDGTGLRQIVDGLAGGDASWAPDGRSIAFSQPSHDGNGYDIYSADVASGNVTRLVTGKATDLWPVWWHPQD